MEEFIVQLNDEQYSSVLKYDNHKLTAVPIVDADGCVHILFYDEEILKTYFLYVTHLFIDATFGTRPKISDCMQLLNVLGGYADRVSSMQINS